MLSIFLSPFFILGALVFFTGWCFWLTYKSLKGHKFGKNLNGQGEINLKEAVEQLEKEVQKNTDEIQKIDSRLDQIDQRSQGFLQKIGLVRYNPFTDTGGQQSFVISILNNNKNGIVVSNLFGRNGSRWFAKRVVEGKSTDLDLTQEEQTSIKLAE